MGDIENVNGDDNNKDNDKNKDNRDNTILWRITMRMRMVIMKVKIT